MSVFFVVAALIAVGVLFFLLPPLLLRRVPGAASEDPTVSVYRAEIAELSVDVERGVLTDRDLDMATRELEQRLQAEIPASLPATAESAAHSPAAPASPVLAFAVAGFILAGTVAVYAMLGSPATADPAGLVANPAPHPVSAEQITAMVERLSARLAANPDDAEGWQMLGRSQATLGRFANAAEALARAQSLAPRDPQILADLADTLAMLSGKSFRGRPKELIEAALAVDPRHPKALALAGTAAFNDGAYGEAIANWERLLGVLPPESEPARSIAGSIADARRRLLSASGPATAAAAVPAPAAPPARGPSAALPAPGVSAEPQTGGTSGPRTAALAPAPDPGGARPAIRGEVSIGPGLAGRVLPDDTVFVFARPADGSRMPLAVIRARGSDLPLAFTLDDSTAMSPERPLSGAGRAIVGVRVSRSGAATAQPGDLTGTTGPVPVGSSGVRVVVDSITP